MEPAPTRTTAPGSSAGPIVVAEENERATAERDTGLRTDELGRRDEPPRDPVVLSPGAGREGGWYSIGEAPWPTAEPGRSSPIRRSRPRRGRASTSLG